MNHFCPALLFLVRASKTTSSKEIRQKAPGTAKKELEYTRVRIRPVCPLNADLEAAFNRARIQEMVLR
jgi:hypothetical protein